MNRLRTDVLILGSGGAGLLAALHAKTAAPGLSVTIAVKGLLGKSGCTRMVQGGYNVALAEGGALTFTISSDFEATEDITVVVNTADVTASAGIDYTAIVLQTATIVAGTTSTTVTVTVADDAIVEA